MKVRKKRRRLSMTPAARKARKKRRAAAKVRQLKKRRAALVSYLETADGRIPDVPDLGPFDDSQEAEDAADTLEEIHQEAGGIAQDAGELAEIIRDEQNALELEEESRDNQGEE